jgi:hypothetical protein
MWDNDTPLRLICRHENTRLQKPKWASCLRLFASIACWIVRPRRDLPGSSKRHMRTGHDRPLPVTASTHAANCSLRSYCRGPHLGEDRGSDVNGRVTMSLYLPIASHSWFARRCTRPPTATKQVVRSRFDLPGYKMLARAGETQG